MTKELKVFSFDENNSGGSWWLDRKQYDALFKAGFTYTPSKYDIEHGYDKNPFRDNENSTVPYGWRKYLQIKASSMKEAVEKWEAATGEDFFAQGCNCCGAPFSMKCEKPYEYMSGDSVSRTVNRPF